MKNVDIYIYTCNVCNVDSTIGAWSSTFCYNNKITTTSNKVENTSDNKIALMATLKSLQRFRCKYKINLYVNNKHLIDAFNKGWVSYWKHRGWEKFGKKELKNVCFWEQLNMLNNVHDIKWIEFKDNINNNNEIFNKCKRLTIEKLLDGERIK